MYCNHCKQNAPVGAEFCPFCGGGLTENTIEKMVETNVNHFETIDRNSTKTKKASTIAVIMIVILVGLNLFQLIYLITLSNNNAKLESDITTKNNRITTLISQVEKYREKANFLDDSMALVADNGTNLYHTYDCSYFTQASSYWAYNKAMAEYEGYYPCPYCH